MLKARFMGLLGSLFCLAGLEAAIPIMGRVVDVDRESRSLVIDIVRSDDAAVLPSEQTVRFRVGTGDVEIGYLDRGIRGNAVSYGDTWHLEQIFPLTGEGATAMITTNARLHEAMQAKSRRKYLREGDVVPDFVMIDQDGRFRSIEDLRGKAFVLNFIFTRCAAPEMCPASSTRMAALQEAARAEGMEDLHFVTITFDPEFDSPGILRQYAKGYGMETENFHLLTGTEQVVEDLLRQFRILTVEEDGTINHTMATLLVDAEGRVAFRKEGHSWTEAEFLEAARAL